MGTTSGVLLVMNFICICVGIGGIIAGGVGHSWWKSEDSFSKSEIGLWRQCITDLINDKTSCGRTKGDILHFKDERLDLDIVLVILIGACFFALFASIAAAAMFCCQNTRRGWFCGSVSVIIVTFFAAGATLAALIYAEVEIKWDGADRGWSVIATWIGAAMFLFSFILSIVLVCLVPRTSDRHYSGATFAMR